MAKNPIPAPYVRYVPRTGMITARDGGGADYARPDEIDDLIHQIPDDRSVGERLAQAVRLLAELNGANEVFDSEWDDDDTFRWVDRAGDDLAEVEP